MQSRRVAIRCYEWDEIKHPARKWEVPRVTRRPMLVDVGAAREHKPFFRSNDQCIAPESDRINQSVSVKNLPNVISNRSKVKKRLPARASQGIVEMDFVCHRLPPTGWSLINASGMQHLRALAEADEQCKALPLLYIKMAAKDLRFTTRQVQLVAWGVFCRS